MKITVAIIVVIVFVICVGLWKWASSHDSAKFYVKKSQWPGESKEEDIRKAIKGKLGGGRVGFFAEGDPVEIFVYGASNEGEEKLVEGVLAEFNLQVLNIRPTDYNYAHPKIL